MTTTDYFVDLTTPVPDHLENRASITLGWDLVMSVVSAPTQSKRAWAEVTLSDSDGNFLMTLARFGGVMALAHAINLVPALIEQVRHFGWTAPYLHPNLRDHHTRPDTVWESPIDKQGA